MGKTRSDNMASVTVAELKMIVRPAVATVAMIAAWCSLPLSRSSRNREIISKPKSMDNPRPNAVATVSACVETSVTLVMSSSTSSVVTIEVRPTAMGRKAATRPPNTTTSTARDTGSAMDLADLEVVLDLGPDLLLNAEGAAGTHRDAGIVRQLRDDVLRARRRPRPGSRSRGPGSARSDRRGYAGLWRICR